MPPRKPAVHVKLKMPPAPPRKGAAPRRKPAAAPRAEADAFGRPEFAWDRQPDETGHAWAAFVAYRDMGPERTFTKLAAALSVSRQATRQMGDKYDWPRRATAYDRYVDAQRQRRNQRRLERLTSRGIDITAKAQAKLLEAFEFALVETGEKSTVFEVLPKWITAVMQAQRTLAGTPSLQVEVSGKGGGPMEVMLDAKQQLASLLGAVMADEAQGEVDPKPDA